MRDVIELINHTRQIPGSSSKVSYLKEHRTPMLDLIVADAMDPSITYGVTSKDIAVECAEGAETDYSPFNQLLGRLAFRDLTGHAALDAITKTLASYPSAYREFLCRILDRDLQLGISWKTYRAEVMGITEKYEVALAQHLEKAKGVNPVDGTWFASRKCDGLRCIAIVDTISGTVEFRSRQNKEFTTLGNLKPAVLRFCSPLTGKWVLDGELCKVNENGDEDFQAMMKEIRRKDYVIENCCYQIFDILTYSEFCAGTSKEILSTRFKRIANLGLEYASSPHEPCYIKPLRQEILRTQADFDRWSDYVSAGNWEGFMLRKNTGYQSGRTKDLLKVKKFFDAEYTVKAIECGKMATSLPGQGTVEYEGVTNLIILHKGNEVGVGAGLSREQRIAWMNNPDLIVGKTVTIKYFETTIAQDGKESLRFPTLKHVYENGRDC